MSLSILAHGGQMTGDEMAIMGGGLSFALLFPVAALIFVVRRQRKNGSPDLSDVSDAPAAAVASEPELSLAPITDSAERT